MYNLNSHTDTRVPVVVKIFMVVFAVFALLTSNPLLTIVAVGVLPLLAKLTWLRSEPPILTFAVSLQWLQVSAPVFYADLQGRVLGSRPDPTEIEQAFWLGMVGLIVLAVGMRMAASRTWGKPTEYLAIDVQQYSLNKIFKIYLLLLIMANLLPGYLWLFLILRSITLALLTLRWVAYFVLVYLSMVAGKGLRQPVLLLATILEIVIGFSGYFSSFKTALFVFMIAFLSSKVRLNNRDILPAVAIIAVAVSLGIAWTAIKPEYRSYLNQGTGLQEVNVSLSDRLLMATDLILNVKGIDAGIAAEQLISRIGYLEFFAHALDYVPRVKVHEEGGLWLITFKHITMPRLLFPDKPPLPSDSELTMQYTGLRLASENEGTSISLGYLAENYIDFGVPLMFIPVFLMGFFWGAIYRYFITTTSVYFIGYGFAMVVLLGAIQIETSCLKMLSGVITNFIVLALLNHFYLRRYAHKLLVGN